MLFAKKTKQRSAPVRDDGFRQADGQNYLDFLGELHLNLKPAWYLEIGTQKGYSLARARGAAIAIDPAFQIETKTFAALPELHMFQLTSDAFFETGWIARNAVQLDFAFLDGMHLFEFLLRDFLNTERASHPGGCIAMHDCVPFNRVMALRDWDKSVTKSWTGDVWKILPILRQYRPQLRVDVVDCAPTGLVVVTGLDPNDRVLEQNYDAIHAEWMGRSLDDYGIDRFATDFPFVPAAEMLARIGRT